MSVIRVQLTVSGVAFVGPDDYALCRTAMANLPVMREASRIRQTAALLPGLNKAMPGQVLYRGG